MRLSALRLRAFEVEASTVASQEAKLSDGGDTAATLDRGRHRPVPGKSVRVRSHSPERATSHRPAAASLLLRASSSAAAPTEPPPSSLPDGTYTLMEAVTAAISEHCRAISRCVDEVEIAAVLHKGGKDLTPLGLCCAQLWLYEAGGGLSSRDADQRRLSWPSSSAQALAQAVGGASHVCLELDGHGGGRWAELVALMRNVAQSHQDSAAGSGVVEEKWCVDSLGMMWRSVYAVPLVAATAISTATAVAADAADADADLAVSAAVGNGYLLATEIDTTAPTALQARGRHVAATKTKQLVAVQCLHQLAAAVAARVRTFADTSLHASIRLQEAAHTVRLESAEHLLAAYEQLARATEPQHALGVLARAATTRLRARLGWVLTPAAVPAAAGAAAAPGAQGGVLAAATVLRTDGSAPGDGQNTNVQTDTLVLDGSGKNLLASLLGVGRPPRAQRSGPRPAAQHVCRSSVLEVSWADLEAAGLCPVEGSSRGGGEDGAGARGAATVTLISVHVATEPGDLDDDEEDDGEAALPHFVYLLAYPHHPSEGSPAPQTAGKDRRSVFEMAEALAGGAPWQERTAQYAADLAVMAARALTRVRAEQHARSAARLQAAANSLFSSVSGPGSSLTAPAGGPSTRHPASEPAAWTVMQHLQSPAFAAAFCAERVVLLLSDTYAASVGCFADESSDPVREIGGGSRVHLVRPAAVSDKGVVAFAGLHAADSPPTAVDAGFAWVADLLAGRPVVVPWLDAVGVDGAGPACRYGDRELVRLVRALHPTARTGLLCPLVLGRATVGLLVVLDKVPSHASTETTAAAATFTPAATFDRHDAAWVAASTACQTAVAALEAARHADDSTVAVGGRAGLHAQVERLGALLKAQRERRAATGSLAQWQAVASARRAGTLSESAVSDALLRAALDLLRCAPPAAGRRGFAPSLDALLGPPTAADRSSSSSSGGISDDARSSYLAAFARCVERHARVMFPKDDVTVLMCQGAERDAVAGAAAPRHGHAHNFFGSDGGGDGDGDGDGSNAAGGGDGVTVSETHRGDFIMRGPIVDRAVAAAPFPALAPGGGVGGVGGVKTVVAAVRVARTHSTRPFSPNDVSVLSRLCGVASGVLAGLRRGLPPDGARDGDVRALLLPLLAHLLPLLLGSSVGPGATGPEADWPSLLTLAARALKRLTGAEAAELRVAPPALVARGEAAAGRREGDWEVSSEAPHSAHAAGRRAEALLQRLLDDRSTRRAEFPAATWGDDALASLPPPHAAAVGQIAMKLLRDPATALDPHHAPWVGEVKVLGKSGAAGFDPDQCAAAQVVAYTLAFALSVQGLRRDHELHAAHMAATVARLEAAVQDHDRRQFQESSAVDACREATHRARQAARFASRAACASTVSELGGLVAELLPRVFRADTALLLRVEAAVEIGAVLGISDEMEYLPVAAGKAHAAAAPVRASQLARLPNHAESPHAPRSKVLLVNKDTGIAYGAILLTRVVPELLSGQLDDAAAALEAELLDCVAAAVGGCFGNADLVAAMGDVQLALQGAEDMQRERDALRREVASLHELKSQADLRHAKAAAELLSLQQALDESRALQEETAQRLRDLADNASARSDGHAERLTRRAEDAEQAARTARAEQRAAEKAREALRAAVTSFASDPRCGGKDGTLAWLNDFATGAGGGGAAAASGLVSAVHMVRRDADGALRGGGEYRGVTTACADALRNGRTVELPSARPAGDDHDAATGSFALLCVPHPADDGNSENEHACVVFAKPAAPFAAADRDVLEAAATLVCRTLWRASDRFSPVEVQRLRAETDQERQRAARTARALRAREDVAARECRDKAELAEAVEAAAKALLLGTAQGPAGVATVACRLHFAPAGPLLAQVYPPGAAPARPLSSDARDVIVPFPGDSQGRTAHVLPWLVDVGLGPEFDMVDSALSTGATQARGAVLWAPLRAPAAADAAGTPAAVVALLRCERQLATVPSAPPVNASLSDLLFRDEEGEVVGLFARLVAPDVDRLRQVREAHVCMEEAAEAMDVLQAAQAALQGRVDELEADAAATGAGQAAAAAAARVAALEAALAEERVRGEGWRREVERLRADGEAAREALAAANTTAAARGAASPASRADHRRPSASVLDEAPPKSPPRPVPQTTQEAPGPALAQMEIDLQRRTTEIIALRERVRALSEELGAAHEALRVRDDTPAQDTEGDGDGAAGKRRALLLEQVAADWRTVARGLNSASTRVAAGVAGVWAQASEVLLSVLGGHVILDGCGLCVAGPDAADVVELSVGDYASPERLGGTTSSEDFAKFGGSGAVDAKPATALGRPIYRALSSLLLDQPRPGGGPTAPAAARRTGIVRFTRRNAHDEFTELAAAAAAAGAGFKSDGVQVWLLPVRTARATVAVVRVTVRLQDPSAARGGSPAWASPIPTALLRADDDDARWEIARSDAVNFAEQLAPLLVAARLFEAADAGPEGRAKKEEELGRCYEQHARYEKELHMAAARYELLWQAVRVVMAAAVGGENDSVPALPGARSPLRSRRMPSPAPSRSRGRPDTPESLAALVASQLSSHFDVAATVQVLKEADRGRVAAGPPSHQPKKGADGSWAVDVVGPDGAPFARLSARAPGDGNTGARPSEPDGDDLIPDIFIDILPEVAAVLSTAFAVCRRAAEDREGAARLQRQHEEALARAEAAHAAAVAASEQLIAQAVAASKQEVANAAAAAAQAVAASEQKVAAAVAASDGAVTQAAAAAAEAQAAARRAAGEASDASARARAHEAAAAAAQRAVAFYRSLLLYSEAAARAAGMLRVVSLPSEAASLTRPDPALDPVVQDLCARLPALLGTGLLLAPAGAAEGIALTVRLGVTARAASVGGVEADNRLLWQAAPAALGGALLDVADGLAAACLAGGTKSATDVGAGPGVGRVRVLTYPLPAPSGTVLGVMQAVVPVDDTRDLGLDARCDEVSLAVASAIALCMRHLTSEYHALAVEETVRMLDEQRRDAEAGEEVQRGRAAAWEAVARAAAVVTAQTAGCEDFSAALRRAERLMPALLADGGVSVLVTSATAPAPVRALEGEEGKAGAAAAAAAVVEIPLDADGTTVATVRCAPRAGAVPIAADLAEAFADVLVAAQRLHGAGAGASRLGAPQTPAAPHAAPRRGPSPVAARGVLSSVRAPRSPAALSDHGTALSDHGTALSEASPPYTPPRPGSARAATSSAVYNWSPNHPAGGKIAAPRPPQRQPTLFAAAKRGQPTAPAGAGPVASSGGTTRPARMVQLVCKELSVLLDPPQGLADHADATLAAHPAMLMPLEASRDTIWKLLGALQTVLRCDGAALLLRDPPSPTNSPAQAARGAPGQAMTCNAVCRGAGLRWPGLEEGDFGTIATSAASTAGDDDATLSSRPTYRYTSLTEACLLMGRPVVVPDGAADPRFHPDVDGQCLSKTPFLAVPLRGRGRAVVGAFLMVRPRGGLPFTSEDVMAAEQVATAGAVALYWCQGLGIAQRKVEKRDKKLGMLESAVGEFQKRLERVDALSARVVEREARVEALEGELARERRQHGEAMAAVQMRLVEQVAAAEQRGAAQAAEAAQAAGALQAQLDARAADAAQAAEVLRSKLDEQAAGAARAAGILQAQLDAQAADAARVVAQMDAQLAAAVADLQSQLVASKNDAAASRAELDAALDRLQTFEGLVSSTDKLLSYQPQRRK